ncbi:MAG: immunoglobulin domain-containing protein [Verrucomicrobiota bacterium]
MQTHKKFPLRNCLRHFVTPIGLGLVVLFAGMATQGEVAVNTLGGGPNEGSTDGNTYLTARFKNPYALALDSAGNLYMADRDNGKVRKVTALGDANNSQTTTFISGLNKPVDVTFDLAGNLLVLTAGDGRVRKYGTAGTTGNLITTLTPVLTAPSAFGLDPAGNIYITQTNGFVKKIDTNGVLTTVTSGFNQPQGIAVLASGNLAVSDTGNNAIRVINLLATNAITILTGGGPAGFVDGSNGVARFNQPYKLAQATNGVLVVADRFNHRVRIIQPNGTVSTLYGVSSNLWNASFYPGWQEGNGTNAHAREPIGVAVSTNGNVYVTEIYWDLLRRATGGNLSGTGESGGGSGLPVITTQPVSQTVGTGSSVSFTVAATGNSLSYQWYYNGIAISGANTNIFSIGGVNAGNAGTYTVRVTNPAGTTTSTDAILTVGTGPTVNQTNSISFGFAGGEASSDFVGAAGQHFYAPVTTSLVPGQKIYTFQFNLSASNLNVAPNLDELPHFITRVLKPAGPVFIPIYPNYSNSFPRLMTLAWLERFGETNLYPTLSQDLGTFSRAHNIFYNGAADGKIIWGGYGFQIPSSAQANDMYQIEVGRPSGTTDGVSAPLGIQAPQNGSLGAGAINAIKRITIQNSDSRKYVVGDTLPFRWVNAGEFGDGYVVNSDIMQVFQSAVYQLNYAPRRSDFFDAMDSSPGSDTNLLNVDDTFAIDTLTFGDGQLMVDDVYVTYRRSLDPTLKWYARFWSDGFLNVVEVPNVFPAQFDAKADAPKYLADVSNGESPFVTFSSGDAIAGTNQTISIPVRAEIKGGLPVRIAMFNFKLEPLESSPAIPSVQFASVLGQPAFSDSQGGGNSAGAWLNRGVAGVYGTNNIGTLTITLPQGLPANAAYAIRFEHASASPNGLGIFPQKLLSGLLTASDRSGSSLNDGIPDSWRLKNFGSVSNNLLSAANADADGDGMLNWQEYRAGTDPIDVLSKLALINGPQKVSNGLKLKWPTVLTKLYVLESATSLGSTNWSVISSNIAGTGATVEFTDTNLVNKAQFYRVRLTE